MKFGRRADVMKLPHSFILYLKSGRLPSEDMEFEH